MARSTFKVLFYVNGSKEKDGIVPIMTSDNQRYCGAVQLQADHPENPLGCERQPSQRQERRSTEHQSGIGQHQGANHQALSAHIRPRGIRNG